MSLRESRDASGLMRQMTSALDRMFDERFFPVFRPVATELDRWMPEIEVFEQDNRLVTRIDLPGMKKEDVKVEVTDGHLAISGERKMEKTETKDRVYRSERQYGSFYRTVPLPEGVKLEDVKATFADGTLDVSVPLPAAPSSKVRTVKIEEPAKAARTAA